MCGIAGSINFGFEKIEGIVSSLYHRGPDEQNSYSYKNINLLHTRLSIQDIAHGTQPFEYEDFVIVFNGEIYNHLELRERYLEDFVFKTLSDTETLLYLHIKYKNKMFDMIDGMFAFCILDKKQNKLILARDRAGKKPLYIYKKDDKIVFASELNGIRSVVDELQIDKEAISSYLRVGLFYGRYTPYLDIKELEASSWCEIDISSLNIETFRYFDIKDCYKTKQDISFEDALQKTDELLHKSIKDRLMSSDLEVGAFLSGGIDSSLIVAIASQYKQNLKSFTVRFDGVYDESHLAQLTANKYNTQHRVIDINIEIKKDIEKILSNYGMPFMDSSAVPSYYVSKEAKKYVKVILNGDGADEIFAGYRRYVPIANNIIEVASKFSFLLGVLPLPHDKKSLYSHIYRLLSISTKKGLDFYLGATVDIFEDIYKFEPNEILNEMQKFILECELDGLSKQLYLDFNILLFSDLLVKMDIATMSHSIEGRSPFLSKYMLEFAPTLPENYKINKKTTKFVLRELAKRYLPQQLISQPKRGFEVPLKSWVDNELCDEIYGSLSGDSYSAEFVDKTFIKQLLNKEISVSDEKRAKMLWDMYCLEVWRKNI